jgi:hypothetical protein
MYLSIVFNSEILVKFFPCISNLKQVQLLLCYQPHLKRSVKAQLTSSEAPCSRPLISSNSLLYRSHFPKLNSHFHFRAATILKVYCPIWYLLAWCYRERSDQKLIMIIWRLRAFQYLTCFGQPHKHDFDGKQLARFDLPSIWCRVVSVWRRCLTTKRMGQSFGLRKKMFIA